MESVHVATLQHIQHVLETYHAYKLEVLLVLTFAIGAVFRVSQKKAAANSSKPSFYSSSDDYVTPTIKPADSKFVWNETPALKSYPFKDAEYKLTMGIKRLDPQDWLLIEPTYLDHIEEKIRITTNSHTEYGDFDLRSSTLFVTPECAPAIREFYDIVVQYMCDKYPKYFQVKGSRVFNSITGQYLPRAASEKVEPIEYLDYLVKNIEEDVIFMLKPQDNPESEYYFKGGIFAFAAGFDPKDKFNTPMTSIHQPIPGYESKLKTSMNRFFNRITPGQFVTRSNFSLQTHNLFFVHDRNKGHNRPEDEVVEPKKEEELDFDKQVHYRSERQVLTRLPKTGAVVFTIRTYLLPLSEVKKDGKEVCARLSGAVEKFPEDIRTYKNAREWGDAVISYLRR
ncbi:hypothetical protein CANTEDRAFT_114301 [Yamadazyma tenuis ATCC 10573]|uniref:HRQ family protein 2 n=1 Tax=Candida tenuis (strain ATCC 10573 / BCRC 21748 / CBS 615 / JCM 9827 / NBRC 10315 / NRRL Y-1498 / VKM Y-70) TaxID=590646 RepID=G3B6P8_CANTC|nr:uncharacterized protein CANTEDRAFT_114301 [Yamadazyma tenuis ATCC 10573]EGV62984.1 hypothetical protein CANTEDRAFT_114301 [Yamadazyma tenuis ATCC 10573]